MRADAFPDTMNDRRQFLKSLASAPAVSALAVAGGDVRAADGRGTSDAGRPLPSGIPRRILHLVADGMSSGILSCANQYSEHVRGRPLTWFRLIDQPSTRQAVMDVRSQNSLVTDSSASSCAWGSGVRIPNGKVNQTSKGQKLVTLYELLGQAGWKRGLVTTTEITHATPAGFIACVSARASGEDIATQYLERRIDLALGGASNHFRGDKRKDKRDLLGDFRRLEYAVLRSPSDLASAPADRRWLGVFSEGHLPYVVDQQGGLTKVSAVPSLAAMTRAALRRFAREERAILQIEGGRVDHGCHSNDAAAAIHELIAFDQAIEVCLEFQREHPDTFLLITTDHATANPGLNGLGDSYEKSNAALHNVRKVRQSVGEILTRLRAAANRAEAAARLKESTGYEASTRRMDTLDPFLKKKGYALFEAFNSDTCALGQVLANHTGIAFTSGNHTSDYVPVLALGPGSERIGGFFKNTDLFGHYLDFAGLSFRNPQEPLVAGACHAPTTEDVSGYLA
jgi:alkaline phosphatase